MRLIPGFPLNAAWTAAVFGALAAASLACGGKEQPAAPRPAPPAAESASPAPGRRDDRPEDYDRWPKEKRERYLRLREELLAARAEAARDRPLEEEQRARDKKELWRPAPPGFKPEDADYKLKLTLRLRDKVVRMAPAGRPQSLWYLLEFQNVGRRPIEFHESSSTLIKSQHDAAPRLLLTDPDGRTRWVHFASRRSFPDFGGVEIKDPEFLRLDGGRKREHVRRESKRRELEWGLSLRLEPGESVVTRPGRWCEPYDEFKRYEKGMVPCPRPPGAYREFFQRSRELLFEKPGAHRLKVVVAFRAGNTTFPGGVRTWMTQSIGLNWKPEKREISEDVLVESNSLEFEVAP